MEIVITGANRGIGLALVRAHLARGDRVYATARRPASAEALQALEASAKGRLSILPLDVTSDSACAALARSLGGAALDLLVNNAGIGDGFSSTLETFDPAEALRLFDTNALGPLRVSRALLRAMRSPGGKLVHVTSRMGSIADNGSGRSYAYRMSKAALNMASVTLAREVASAGLLSVVVHPGWVKTDMGGPDAQVEPEVAAAQIVALCDRLTLEDTGKFFHANGQALPW